MLGPLRVSGGRGGILLGGVLLELVGIALVSALAVALFADGAHLTRAIGGAIGGAYVGMLLNVALAVIAPGAILLLPVAAAVGATLGANLFAPAAEAGPLLSPTARAAVASW